MWHLELSNQLVQNQFLRQWKQMTAVEAPVSPTTFKFFTSTILELVFSLNALMQHLLLDIFAEFEHSPLLFVAD